jgi:hypothetical protein
MAPALRHIAKGGNEQAPPPVDVLIFKPLLVAEMGVQRGRDAGAMDGNYRVLLSRFAGSLDTPATADKAWNNIGGNSFPRFSARRRIPRQAFAVK